MDVLLSHLNIPQRMYTIILVQNLYYCIGRSIFCSFVYFRPYLGVVERAVIEDRTMDSFRSDMNNQFI